MKELTLKMFWGGLGDHLLYSPIPRLAKQFGGYDRVYISNKSAYRNPNTKRLVWEYNPFVDGFTDSDADYAKFSTIELDRNILDKIIEFFNFKTDDTKFREPEIYYKPKFLSEFADAIIYDPNYVSEIKHPSSEAINSYFKTCGIIPTHQMKCISMNRPIAGLIEIQADNLEYFCDIIFSCKAFYCLVSGPATLAAAIRKPAVVFYDNSINSMFLHSKLNSYRCLV